MKPKVIAILCADIHLSHKPPIWRSNEPDWYVAMARPLNEIQELQAKYKCPILCAGDIFDKWNSPAELINWAMIHLPKEMFSIPGQHDFCYHNIEDLHRSAYWTLVEAKKITNIELNKPLELADYKIKLYGFPWGMKLQKCYDRKIGWKHIALIHKYLWTKDYKYKKALETDNVKKYAKILKTYDVVVVGDNHKSFVMEL